MRWKVHAERPLYENRWISLALAEVEFPDGTRIEHHVMRSPAAAVGVLAHTAGGVLLLWRHRFITDSWGWELPAGGVGDGETVEDAARRETLEETGWAVGQVDRLLTYNPMNGISDQQFHVCITGDVRRAGAPVDRHEAERVEWLPVQNVVEEIATGNVRDGLTLTALSYALFTGAIA